MQFHAEERLEGGEMATADRTVRQWWRAESGGAGRRQQRHPGRRRWFGPICLLLHTTSIIFLTMGGENRAAAQRLQEDGVGRQWPVSLFSSPSRFGTITAEEREGGFGNASPFYVGPKASVAGLLVKVDGSSAGGAWQPVSRWSDEAMKGREGGGREGRGFARSRQVRLRPPGIGGRSWLQVRASEDEKADAHASGSEDEEEDEIERKRGEPIKEEQKLQGKDPRREEGEDDETNDDDGNDDNDDRHPAAVHRRHQGIHKHDQAVDSRISEDKGAIEDKKGDREEDSGAGQKPRKPKRREDRQNSSEEAPAAALAAAVGEKESAQMGQALQELEAHGGLGTQNPDAATAIQAAVPEAPVDTPPLPFVTTEGKGAEGELKVYEEALIKGHPSGRTAGASSSTGGGFQGSQPPRKKGPMNVKWAEVGGKCFPRIRRQFEKMMTKSGPLLSPFCSKKILGGFTQLAILSTPVLSYWSEHLPDTYLKQLKTLHSYSKQTGHWIDMNKLSEGCKSAVIWLHCRLHDVELMCGGQEIGWVFEENSDTQVIEEYCLDRSSLPFRYCNSATEALGRSSPAYPFEGCRQYSLTQHKGLRGHLKDGNLISKGKKERTKPHREEKQRKEEKPHDEEKPNEEGKPHEEEKPHEEGKPGRTEKPKEQVVAAQAARPVVPQRSTPSSVTKQSSVLAVVLSCVVAIGTAASLST